jgi:hypothetical protein
MKLLKEEKASISKSPCFSGLTLTPLVVRLEFQAYFLYFLQKKLIAI